MQAYGVKPAFGYMRQKSPIHSSNKPDSSPNLLPAASSGFTIVEALIAFTLFLVFFAAVGGVIVRPQLVGKRAATYDAIEAAISHDLGWIKSYSKAWRCLNGRYQGCQAVTSSLSYNPTSTECSNLANAFLSSASSVVTTPPRPNAVPSSAAVTASAGQALALPSSASGTTLVRTISTDASGNRINIAYESSGNVELIKQASVYIEAAAWCQP